MPISSRNDTPTYTYFFVTKNNNSTLSKLFQYEFFIYQFQNPVSAARGISYLTDQYTINVIQLTKDQYNKESFTHPKYTNQKNEPLQFEYTLLPINLITVDLMRN